MSLWAAGNFAAHIKGETAEEEEAKEKRERMDGKCVMGKWWRHRVEEPDIAARKEKISGGK